MTENLLPESLVCSFRWVKFEEDVEDGSNRWSKPHVATLSLHSLFELRNLLTKGTILLDMEASKYEINFIHLLDSFLIVALISLSNVLVFYCFFMNFSRLPTRIIGDQKFDNEIFIGQKLKSYESINYLSFSHYLFISIFNATHCNVSLVWMILPTFFWINASITTFYQMIWGYLSKML